MIPASSKPATEVLDEASRFCRRLAESHYENFSVASRLLPKNLRPHFHHIYAYCRWSDDLADESENPQQALEKLDNWQKELDDCFQGRPSHPIMIALYATVEEFDLKQEPFNNLLSAFRQDQNVLRYESDEQLIDYCRRSADPVGRILLGLARIDAQECLAWSDSICTGLQLANFCQDMSRDAAMNRIYLPKSRWAARGVDEAMILQRKSNEALKQTTLDWCNGIAEYFHRGWELTRHVPSWLARDVRLFAGGGLKVLDKIAEADGDVWTKRLEVGKFDKLCLMLRACMTSRPPRRKRYDVNSRSRSTSLA